MDDLNIGFDQSLARDVDEYYDGESRVERNLRLLEEEKIDEYDERNQNI